MPRLVVLLAPLLLAACGFGADGPQVIDGSSDEAFERTLSEARGELGPRDRLKFEAAMTEYRAQVFAEADTRQDYRRMVREGMDGLTSQAIVAKFDENADKLGNEAADAIFDAKRVLTGGG
jgi:hypothetical protein